MTTTETQKSKSKNFRDLIVWKKAHEWVLNVYEFTKRFPKEELFGLTSQLRRSAVSVPANIVEGFKRYGLNDKIRFYNIAQSSLEESRYYLILSHDLKYGDSSDLLNELENVSKLLARYQLSTSEARERIQ